MQNVVSSHQRTRLIFLSTSYIILRSAFVAIVEYKYLFQEFRSDKEAKILALIGGVNFTMAFPIVARLNHVVREKKFENYHYELDFWFGLNSRLTFFNTDLVAAVYDEQELEKLRILNIWSNLTLLPRFLESYKMTRNISKDMELRRVNDRSEILPLTMIALNTFILFQKEIIDGPLKLENLIPRYWQYKQGLMALGMQHIYRAV